MTNVSPTDSTFIKKLTTIVEANLANEHFGVKELSEESGISHSQIHRKLHILTKQSASQFIREIRLNKAIELLQPELYTIAEIAFKVGFGSPTYFNKCFHDYFGYPPGEHKNHKKNDAITENISSKVDKDFQTTQTSKTNSGTKRIWQNKFIQFAFGILLIVALSFFAYSYFNGNSVDTNRDKSIAVLPLRNLSSDTENQHLADGIMEDILNRLLHIQEFKVVSRISAETYNSSETTIHDIAKELGVSYVLEGSLFRYGNKVSLYVQLIEAKYDNPIWSAKYDNDLSDIFVFVSDVSRQIADELQVVLSPKEKEQLEKKYTENKEAYSLYLEGRFYWQLRGEENLRKSIEYYNKALAIDSNYCLAYAGLADTYIELAWFRFEPRRETIPKSREYIQNALAIDNNLAEAHAIQGVIAVYFDYNWNLAEKSFQRAIEINPNYATAYQWYSEYFDMIGNHEQARLYINKAIELKPHIAVMRHQSYFYYLKEGDYDRALEESDKIFEINKNSTSYHWKKFNIYLRLGEGQKAANEFKNLIQLNFPELKAELLDSIYAEAGIEGIVRYRIEFELKKDIYNDLTIARFYAMLKENNSALNHLEKSLANGNLEMLRIKFDLDFKELRTEPRFLALLEKMNLGEY